MQKAMKNLSKILIPSVLFLLAIFFVGINLNKPFWGEHDWNGARYGNIARNYVRYGLVTTKLGQVENGGISKPSDFIYYTHYQPFLSLLIAGSYEIFGISEFTTRLVPLIATAGLIVILFLIGKTLFSNLTGIFSALIALATPMVRYYGKNPVHEPMASFFGALAFYGAVLIKKKNKYGWGILITGLVLTALTNWSFIFLIAGLTVFLYERKFLVSLLKIWGLAVALGLLHFVHAYILTGSIFGGGLVGALLLRTSIDQSTTNFGLIGYFLRIRIWSSTLFTNTLLLTSAVGLIFLIWKKNSEIIRLTAGLIIFSFYSIFFANASFIHSYFIYYFILPLSFLAGYIFFTLSKINKKFIVLGLIILAGTYFERNSYINALNASSGDKLAYEIGKSLNSKTIPTDLILVTPSEYAESRLPMLSYYSERNIVSEGPANWKVAVTGDSFNITRQK